MTEVTFEGIPSGDHECFCWAVDEETFTRVTGKEPGEFDGNPFNEGLFSLYPSDAMDLGADEKTKMKFRIETEPL